MSGGRKRLLVVGLDGATLDLALPWADEGKLPNIKQLLDSGAYGPLYSPIALTPPAWSTIYTGKQPGKHDIFHFIKRKEGSYDFRTVNSTDRDARDLWEILSDGGKKVGVINAPVTFPPSKVEGVMVSGFMTPGESSQYTYPPELKERVQRLVPGYYGRPPFLLRVGLTNRFYVRMYLNVVFGKIERLGALTATLMKEADWDFFMLVFSETDVVQHGFWGAMDPNHRIVSRSHKKRHGNVIQEVYARIDAQIGKVMEQVGEADYVMIVSDHGGASMDTIFHMNDFLESIGLLHYRKERKKRRRWRVILEKYLIEVQRLFGLLAIVGVVKKYLAHNITQIDWARTRAFFEGGGIYVNLAGREAMGTVAPGREYEEVREEIRKRLLSVRDPRTGAKAVQQVWFKEELYSGPHADEAPDLNVSMKTGYQASPWGSVSDSIFSDSTEWSGGHSHEGIFILRGPGVKKGRVEGLEVNQVAPTALYVLGEKVPEDMDGDVAEKLFDQGHLKARPVERVSVSNAEKPGRELSSEDQRVVEDRLRALGYM